MAEGGYPESTANAVGMPGTWALGQHDTSVLRWQEIDCQARTVDCATGSDVSHETFSKNKLGLMNETHRPTIPFQAEKSERDQVYGNVNALCRYGCS